MRRRWSVVLGVVMVVAMFGASGAAAARHGTDRPFGGSMTGELTWEFDWNDPECPVTTITEATGQLLHLGRATSYWTHCPPAVEGQTAYTNGHVTFTAANGDQLVGEYEDADGYAPFVVDVVGGTGRFANATGVIELIWFEAVGEWGSDDLPIEPWFWAGEFAGSISY